MDFRQPVEAIVPDAQGRILATLACTTQELSLSALADLSGVSLAHVGRIVPRLVELGVAERRDVPPTVLVRLVPEHLASRAILMLTDLRHMFHEELRETAQRLDPAPVNVTLFGSFARGDDDAESDVDVVVVRPSAVDEDDVRWADSLAHWEAHVRSISGNAVNRIEVAESEAPKLAKSRRPLWQAIRREGIALQGRSLVELGAVARAEDVPKATAAGAVEQAERIVEIARTSSRDTVAENPSSQFIDQPHAKLRCRSRRLLTPRRHGLDASADTLRRMPHREQPRLPQNGSQARPHFPSRITSTRRSGRQG